MSKTIIVTGASRGIGLAISTHLLSLPAQHKVLLISRTTPQPLLDLQSAHADRVRLITGDLSSEASGRSAIEQALQHAKKWDGNDTAGEGALHGLIVNHGTLGSVVRVANSTATGWADTFQVNVFSVVGVVAAALPALRKSKGTIVFTSSGAAQNAYSTWGAYGASKAALNHLALTLEREEPDVTTVSVRPGVVDSEMQREIREVHHETMDVKDREKFLEAKSKGTLLRPEQPGNVIARLGLSAPKELSGKFLSWNDEALRNFQD